MQLIYMSLEDVVNKYPNSYYLVLGKDSAMSYYLQQSSKIRKRISVTLCLINDKPVAWSWLFRQDSDSLKNKYTFMVYVKPSYRRLGIGKKLLEDAQRTVKARKKSFLVYPWDPVSKKFYSSIKKNNHLVWYLLPT